MGGGESCAWELYITLKSLLAPARSPHCTPWCIVLSKVVSSVLSALLENGSFVDFALITVFSNISSAPKGPDHIVNPQRREAARLSLGAGVGPGRHLISLGRVSRRAL